MGPKNPISYQFQQTLLRKHWWKVCIIAVSVFSGMLTIIWLHSRLNLFSFIKGPRSCKNPDLFKWKSPYLGIVFGGTFGSFIVKSAKFLVAFMNQSQTKDISGLLFVVFSILLVSSALQWFTWLKQFYCLDSDIRSSIFLWAELLVTVPIAYFVDIAMNTKPDFVLEDYVILGLVIYFVSSNFLVVNGFIPESLKVTVAVSSFIAISWPTYINYNRSLEFYRTLLARPSNSPVEAVLLKLTRRKSLKGVYLAIIPPCFFTAYFLQMTKLMDIESIHILSAVVNLGFKILLSILMIEDQSTETLDPTSLRLILERTANESRRDFLRYMFHEVRVPLNSISMGLHVLRDDVLATNDTAGLNLYTIDAMRETEISMTQTLNDVLMFQKIEEGKLELVMEPFLISTMLESVQTSVKKHLLDKNIKLVLECSENIPVAVLGDRYRIEHVLCNLISNGVRFSTEFSEIKLTLRNESENLRFSVIDYGPGVSKEQQKRLFASQSSGMGKTAHSSWGPGVRLAICRELVRLHGGVISCRSNGNDENPYQPGSEFYFSLPMKICSVEDVTAASEQKIDHKAQLKLKGQGKLDITHPDQSIVKSGQDNSSLTSKFQVLIVDDVPSNRKILKAILSKKGLYVDMAENGQQCLNFVADNKIDYYDIIFMDNLMPIMCGTEASTALRAKGFPNIIVGLTGNAMEEDVKEFEEAGADLVLSKPLKIDDLDSLLLQCQIVGCKSNMLKHQEKN